MSKVKFAIDFSKLDAREQEIETRTTSKYLRASKIKGSVVVRLLPDPRLNGDFAVECLALAAPNGKGIINTQNHLGDCEVVNAYEDALRNKSTKANADKLNKRYSYAMPVLIVTEDKDLAVSGLKPTVLVVPTTVYKDISSLLRNAKYRKAAELSIMDKEGGINLTIERKGEGLETKYTITPDPSPTDMEKLAKDNKALTTIIEESYDPETMVDVLSTLAEDFDPAKELTKLNEFIETGKIGETSSDD